MAVFKLNNNFHILRISIISTWKFTHKIYLWKNKDGKLNSFVLEKIIKTLKEKYSVEFVFCKPDECGKKIIELLGVKE